jgi:hypothetical protein
MYARPCVEGVLALLGLYVHASFTKPSSPETFLEWVTYAGALAQERDALNRRTDATRKAESP